MPIATGEVIKQPKHWIREAPRTWIGGVAAQTGDWFFASDRERSYWGKYRREHGLPAYSEGIPAWKYIPGVEDRVKEILDLIPPEIIDQSRRMGNLALFDDVYKHTSSGKVDYESFVGIEHMAQERASLEWLCKVNAAVPTGGTSVEELESLGFRAQNDGPCYGGVSRELRAVIFPGGWSMTPKDLSPISPLSYAAHVLDTDGQPRMNIEFHNSDAYDSRRGWTTII